MIDDISQSRRCVFFARPVTFIMKLWLKQSCIVILTGDCGAQQGVFAFIMSTGGSR